VGETLMILDCGGGTVDAVTYSVSGTLPLRLATEIVPAAGEVIGATIVNNKFRSYCLNKLKGENLWEQGLVFSQEALEQIVDERIMKDFELKVKRTLDFNVPSTAHFWYDVPFLKQDMARGFRRGSMGFSM
jgi:hypothetical protein